MSVNPVNKLSPGKRLVYLDTARALAALSTVIWHFCTALLSYDKPGFVRDSPFHLFWYGDADVTFFFIHSGFILTYCNRQFAESISGASYVRFLTGRVFRIYPLYLFILLVSHLLAVTVYPLSSGHYLTAHFHEYWNFRKSWGDVSREALLVIRMPENSVDRYLPQDWTLTVELIASAILPLLNWMMRRQIWVCGLLILLLARLPWLTTYLLEFGLGVFLYYAMGPAVAWWKRSAAIWRWSVIVLALLFSSCLLSFSDYLGSGRSLLGVTPDRLLVAAGCCLCFVVLLSSPRVQRLLSHPWLVRCGEACYGLYLWHLLLLIVGADIGMQALVEHTALPLWADRSILLIAVLVMTICLSLWSHTLIERPLIRLGKKLGASAESLLLRTNRKERLW
jgi:peptidoglycan/LPS O-acetylase OafA/YrhL